MVDTAPAGQQKYNSEFLIRDSGSPGGLTSLPLRVTMRAISYKAVTKTEQQEAPQRAGYGVNRRAEASSHRFRAGDPNGVPQ